MITIQNVEETPEISSFLRSEWGKMNEKHFGRDVNWDKEKFMFRATENDELLGILELTIKAGVMFIDDIILSEKHRSRGIGKQLMGEADKLAREKRVHKIYLETGKTWEAVHFYEKIGYKKMRDIPNHWANHDYVEFVKKL